MSSHTNSTWIWNLIRLIIFIKYRDHPWEETFSHLWIVRASGWLVFLLKPISRVKDPILVGVWKFQSGISWRFNGVLFLVLIYSKAFGFFYCSTLSTISNFHTIFMPMEGLRFRWDIDLFGEYYNANYIMCWCIFSIYYIYIRLSGRNIQNNSCKNVQQWRNSVISPLSCCEPL